MEEDIERRQSQGILIITERGVWRDPSFLQDPAGHGSLPGSAVPGDPGSALDPVLPFVDPEAGEATTETLDGLSSSSCGADDDGMDFIESHSNQNETFRKQVLGIIPQEKTDKPKPGPESTTDGEKPLNPEHMTEEETACPDMKDEKAIDHREQLTEKGTAYFLKRPQQQMRSPKETTWKENNAPSLVVIDSLTRKVDGINEDVSMKNQKNSKNEKKSAFVLIKFNDLDNDKMTEQELKDQEKTSEAIDNKLLEELEAVKLQLTRDQKHSLLKTFQQCTGDEPMNKSDAKSLAQSLLQHKQLTNVALTHIYSCLQDQQPAITNRSYKDLRNLGTSLTHSVSGRDRPVFYSLIEGRDAEKRKPVGVDPSEKKSEAEKDNDGQSQKSSCSDLEHLGELLDSEGCRLPVENTCDFSTYINPSWSLPQTSPVSQAAWRGPEVKMVLTILQRVINKMGLDSLVPQGHMGSDHTDKEEVEIVQKEKVTDVDLEKDSATGDCPPLKESSGGQPTKEEEDIYKKEMSESSPVPVEFESEDKAACKEGADAKDPEEAPVMEKSDTEASEKAEKKQLTSEGECLTEGQADQPSTEASAPVECDQKDKASADQSTDEASQPVLTTDQHSGVDISTSSLTTHQQTALDSGSSSLLTKHATGLKTKKKRGLKKTQTFTQQQQPVDKKKKEKKKKKTSRSGICRKKNPHSDPGEKLTGMTEPCPQLKRFTGTRGKRAGLTADAVTPNTLKPEEVIAEPQKPRKSGKIYGGHTCSRKQKGMKMNIFEEEQNQAFRKSSRGHSSTTEQRDKRCSSHKRRPQEAAEGGSLSPHTGKVKGNKRSRQSKKKSHSNKAGKYLAPVPDGTPPVAQRDLSGCISQKDGQGQDRRDRHKDWLGPQDDLDAGPQDDLDAGPQDDLDAGPQDDLDAGGQPPNMDMSAHHEDGQGGGGCWTTDMNCHGQGESELDGPWPTKDRLEEHRGHDQSPWLTKDQPEEHQGHDQGPWPTKDRPEEHQSHDQGPWPTKDWPGLGELEGSEGHLHGLEEPEVIEGHLPPIKDWVDVQAQVMPVRKAGDAPQGSSGNSNGSSKSGGGGASQGWGGARPKTPRGNTGSGSGSGTGGDGGDDDDDDGRPPPNRTVPGSLAFAPADPKLTVRRNYKKHRKKQHGNISNEQLCHCLGQAGKGLEVLRQSSGIGEVDRCLRLCLHDTRTVTSPTSMTPEDMACCTCAVLISLLSHFSGSAHGHSCPLCLQLFTLVSLHLLLCQASVGHGGQEEEGEEDGEGRERNLCRRMRQARMMTGDGFVTTATSKMWTKVRKYLSAALGPALVVDLDLEGLDTESSVFLSGQSISGHLPQDAPPQVFLSGEEEVMTSGDQETASTPFSLDHGSSAAVMPSRPAGSGTRLFRRPSTKVVPQKTIPEEPGTLQPSLTPPSPNAAASFAGEGLDQATGGAVLEPLPITLPTRRPETPEEQDDWMVIFRQFEERQKQQQEQQRQQQRQRVLLNDDPYSTQKTYGPSARFRSMPEAERYIPGDQTLSLEMHPVGTPGIGEVVYGTTHQLCLVARNWAQERDRCKASGNCQYQHREEGVILHAFKGHLKILRTRFQKHQQWERLVHLGNGVTGKCHLCIDRTSNFKFCCKKVHILQYEDQELEIWSELDHPNITRLYGAIRHGEKIYMFAEFIDGGSLAAMIKEQWLVGRRLSHWTALNYFRQLLEVLKYLETKGVLHEDIKADNLLLRDGTTEIVVADFGVAQRIPNDHTPPNRCPTGSPAHWSPEKAAYMGHGFSSDLWAAACVLIHMLSGSPPWISRYPDAGMLNFIIWSKPPPLDDVPADVKEGVRDMLACCLVKDKAIRPTAEQILSHRAFRLLDQATSFFSIAQAAMAGGPLAPVSAASPFSSGSQPAPPAPPPQPAPQTPQQSSNPAPPQSTNSAHPQPDVPASQQFAQQPSSGQFVQEVPSCQTAASPRPYSEPQSLPQLSQSADAPGAESSSAQGCVRSGDTNPPHLAVMEAEGPHPSASSSQPQPVIRELPVIRVVEIPRPRAPGAPRGESGPQSLPASATSSQQWASGQQHFDSSLPAPGHRKSDLSTPPPSQPTSSSPQKDEGKGGRQRKRGQVLPSSAECVAVVEEKREEQSQGEKRAGGVLTEPFTPTPLPELPSPLFPSIFHPSSFPQHPHTLPHELERGEVARDEEKTFFPSSMPQPSPTLRGTLTIPAPAPAPAPPTQAPVAGLASASATSNKGADHLSAYGSGPDGTSNRQPPLMTPGTGLQHGKSQGQGSGVTQSTPLIRVGLTRSAGQNLQLYTSPVSQAHTQLLVTQGATAIPEPPQSLLSRERNSALVTTTNTATGTATSAVPLHPVQVRVLLPQGSGFQIAPENQTTPDTPCGEVSNSASNDYPELPELSPHDIQVSSGQRPGMAHLVTLLSMIPEGVEQESLPPQAPSEGCSSGESGTMWNFIKDQFVPPTDTEEQLMQSLRQNSDGRPRLELYNPQNPTIPRFDLLQSSLPDSSTLRSARLVTAPEDDPAVLAHQQPASSQVAPLPVPENPGQSAPHSARDEPDTVQSTPSASGMVTQVHDQPQQKKSFQPAASAARPVEDEHISSGDIFGLGPQGQQPNPFQEAFQYRQQQQHQTGQQMTAGPRSQGRNQHNLRLNVTPPRTPVTQAPQTGGVTGSASSSASHLSDSAFLLHTGLSPMTPFSASSHSSAAKLSESRSRNESSSSVSTPKSTYDEQEYVLNTLQQQTPGLEESLLDPLSELSFQPSHPNFLFHEQNENDPSEDENEALSRLQASITDDLSGQLVVFEDENGQELFNMRVHYKTKTWAWKELAATFQGPILEKYQHFLLALPDGTHINWHLTYDPAITRVKVIQVSDSHPDIYFICWCNKHLYT